MLWHELRTSRVALPTRLSRLDPHMPSERSQPSQIAISCWSLAGNFADELAVAPLLLTRAFRSTAFVGAGVEELLAP